MKKMPQTVRLIQRKNRLINHPTTFKKFSRYFTLNHRFGKPASNNHRFRPKRTITTDDMIKRCQDICSHIHHRRSISLQKVKSSCNGSICLIKACVNTLATFGLFFFKVVSKLFVICRYGNMVSTKRRATVVVEPAPKTGLRK